MPSEVPSGSVPLRGIWVVSQEPVARLGSCAESCAKQPGTEVGRDWWQYVSKGASRKYAKAAPAPGARLFCSPFTPTAAPPSFQEPTTAASPETATELPYSWCAPVLE